MSSTTNQRTTTDYRPPTTDVLTVGAYDQLKISTKFYFLEQDLFSLSLLNIINDRPTTTDERPQLEHTTNKRSRSSFIFGDKIYFSLRLLDVNNDRPDRRLKVRYLPHI